MTFKNSFEFHRGLDPSKLFIEVFSDVISVGVDSVLAQKCGPIAYHYDFSSMELFYYERKCLIFISALKNFRCYFNELPVKVIKYHNVNIKHRARKKNVVAHTLSRNQYKCMETVEEVKACILSPLVLK